MATVSFRMDDTLKAQTEAILDALGLNMTTAMTMFAKTIVREKRIPLDLSIDPFYSRENMERLKTAINDVNSGIAVLKEHDLIEVDE